MKATHRISVIYFPKDNIAEMTWEDIETGEGVCLTTIVPPRKGRELAQVVQPCVYHGAAVREEFKKLRAFWEWSRLTDRMKFEREYEEDERGGCDGKQGKKNSR